MSKPKLRAGGKRIPPWGPFGIGHALVFGELCQFHPDEKPQEYSRAQLKAAWVAYRDKVEEMARREGLEPWAASNL